MIWARICPVCREELPERGNRRVYVPWKRGFRLVHAGECFDAIDAQQVLEATTVVNDKPRRRPDLAVWAVRKRAALAAYPGELTRDAVEDVLARARLLVPALKQQLVGDEEVDGARQRHEEVLGYARRYLARLHAREVSGQGRMELFA